MSLYATNVAAGTAADASAPDVASPKRRMSSRLMIHAIAVRKNDKQTGGGETPLTYLTFCNNLLTLFDAFSGNQVIYYQTGFRPHHPGGI
jgi:hypothetical protein